MANIPPEEQPTPAKQKATRRLTVKAIANDAITEHADEVVVEEPVEIRIVYGPRNNRSMRNLSITMRTPGDDEELAAGFLAAERIVTTRSAIERFTALGTDKQGIATGNILRVDLAPDIPLDIASLQRHFFTTSSCGVCGKASLEALAQQGLSALPKEWQLSRDELHQLPSRLRDGQRTFQRTGGLHAAGLCDRDGNMSLIREDVGRHNAVDKVVGRSFLDEQLPLSKYAMIISGRASFEILQKALVAGIPIVVAVGAPSTLAVDMAREYEMTLVGFASDERFNIYSVPERIKI